MQEEKTQLLSLLSPAKPSTLNSCSPKLEQGKRVPRSARVAEWQLTVIHTVGDGTRAREVQPKNITSERTNSSWRGQEKVNKVSSERSIWLHRLTADNKFGLDHYLLVQALNDLRPCI